MKKRAVFVLLVLAALAVSCKDKPPESSCIWGNDIPDEHRVPIIQTGDQLINKLLANKLDELYEAGTEEMKNIQTRDQFTFTIKMFTGAFGPVDFPRAEEVYYMTSKGKQEQVWISCNLGEPGINDLYGMPTNRELAVMIYKARTDLELIRIIIQLEKQDGVWKLRSMSLNPATIKHRSSDYYAGQALKYREQNLLHLAMLYYKSAIFLSDIGLNVNEFAVNIFVEQMNQIKVDYMPAGQAQIWSMPSGASYNVYNLDAAYSGGNHLVHLSYITSSLEDKEMLEKQARELAQFLDKKFPEYRKGFDGFKVTAASEKMEERMVAYHSMILFKDLDKKAEPGPEKKEDKKGP